MNEPLEAAAVDCVHKVQGKEDQGNEAHYILGALSSVSKARPWKEGTPLKEGRYTRNNDEFPSQGHIST
jgi:hypothetical protein